MSKFLRSLGSQYDVIFVFAGRRVAVSLVAVHQARVPLHVRYP